jgi:hypothetical protein
MPETPELTREEVMAILQEGGELWYFYLDGGVGIHDKNGEPMKDRRIFCPIRIFLELREQKVIDMTRRNSIGYPYYANNHKSDVYSIPK